MKVLRYCVVLFLAAIGIGLLFSAGAVLDNLVRGETLGINDLRDRVEALEARVLELEGGE